MSEFNLDQPHGFRERGRSPKKTRRELLGIGSSVLKSPKSTPRESVSPSGFKLTRRGFVKSLAAAAAGLTAAGLGLDIVRREPVSDEAKYYQTRLTELDKKIIDINSFEEVAPQAGELAVEYFSKEMGYDATRYQGRLHFLRDSDYIKRRRETGCIETQANENEGGFINALLPDLFFNLSFHLKFSKNRAQMLFTSILHELFHVSAPTVVNMDIAPQNKFKGVLILQPNHEQSIPGDVCYDTFAVALEEAIVTDATDRMVQKLGLKKMIPDYAKDYKAWMENYRRGIIDKLFGGDHRPLLKLHQGTRQDDFNSLIGQKLGAPAGQAAQWGDAYTYGVLIEGR